MDLATEQKLKTFGISTSAVPYSNLCNHHEGARDKYQQMGKKHDDVFQEKANLLRTCIKNIAKTCVVENWLLGNTKRLKEVQKSNFREFETEQSSKLGQFLKC